MERESKFKETFFSAHTIREAAEILFGTKNLENEIGKNLSLKIGKDVWKYDSVEQFLASYQNQNGYTYCHLYANKKGLILSYQGDRSMIVNVSAETHGEINATFSVFERVADKSKLPPLPEQPKPKIPPPVVFIGHGRSSLWRDLKDHLSEKHDYRVEAYEVGARAGHTIRDILEDMLDKSSFACLVLTAEDEMADGTMRARQNVIHETGLFQGRLGFSRAIVMLEEGAEEFSNVQGVQQIRFSKGNIKETFGEVLATLRREFHSKKDKNTEV